MSWSFLHIFCLILFLLFELPFNFIVSFKTYELQDVFGIVPGDTDYRIFANDHGNIPGLDIIYLIGGYYYHTTTDTVERLLYAYCYFGTVRYQLVSFNISNL